MLPGPYTFIMPVNRRFRDFAVGRQKTIGVEIPDCPVTLEVARQLRRPLFTLPVSSGSVGFLDPFDLEERYGRHVDLVVDGGVLPNELTTAIDCTGSEPMIARMGKGAIDSRPQPPFDASELPEFTLTDVAFGHELADPPPFVVTLDAQGSMVFRDVSILGDFWTKTDSGIAVPRRAVLLHKARFGGVSVAELEELQELINAPRAREKDFQDFFERHPHFLGLCNYQQVHPQVILAGEEAELVPDFILTDPELHKAAVMELKLPQAKLVRRQHNRDRFAAIMTEARSQLLRYRDWFDRKENRQALASKVGMEIYKPALIVVIGRSDDFRHELDRQQLSADFSDLEVVTYDDILKSAERRLMILAPE